VVNKIFNSVQISGCQVDLNFRVTSIKTECICIRYIKFHGSKSKHRHMYLLFINLQNSVLECLLFCATTNLRIYLTF